MLTFAAYVKADKHCWTHSWHFCSSCFWFRKCWNPSLTVSRKQLLNCDWSNAVWGRGLARCLLALTLSPVTKLDKWIMNNILQSYSFSRWPCLPSVTARYLCSCFLFICYLSPYLHCTFFLTFLVWFDFCLLTSHSFSYHLFFFFKNSPPIP